jgi:hypothetical protein
MPRRNHTIKHQHFIDKNTCALKRRFANEKAALQAAEFHELQNNQRFSIYKCERCGNWHLTRQKDTKLDT